MMSWACGRWSIGKTCANSSGSVSQPEATCGDSDDVAQVSMTSGSAMKPPGTPRWSSEKPGGTSDDGSTGSDSSGASRGSSYTGSPEDRKSTRLNSSHANISYAVFCLNKN